MLNNIRDLHIRSKKAYKNVAVMIIIKGISMIISFLYVPLLFHTLDTINYGIWLTLTSVFSWISLFDIGLGNGLRNKVAESMAKGDDISTRKYVSTTYAFMTLFIIGIIAVFLCIYTFVPWASILNASGINDKEFQYLVLIVFISFCTHFVLNLINSILYALQMPAMSSAISMMGQLLAFIVVYVLSTTFNNSSLLVLGFAISVTPVIVLLTATIILFSTKYKFISPSFSFIEFEKIKNVASLGAQFFIIQIISIVLFQVNTLVITHVVGNEAVVEYNIAYKYMYLLYMLFSIIATPIWSATTDAYRKGDFEWIRSIHSNLRLVALILSIIGLIMLIVSSKAYDLWINNLTVEINYSTTGLLFVYTVAMMFYGSNGFIINGIGKLRIQIIVTGLLAIGYIPASILMGLTFGLDGILSVFAFSAIINCLWSSIQCRKLIKNSAVGIWNK